LQDGGSQEASKNTPSFTLHPAHGPIHGQSVPDIGSISNGGGSGASSKPPSRFKKEPSIITDRGDQMLASLKQKGRTPTPPKPIYPGESLEERLLGALERPHRETKGFLPKCELESVIKFTTRDITKLCSANLRG
jgi:hypothetical protein